MQIKRLLPALHAILRLAGTPIASSSSSQAGLYRDQKMVSFAFHWISLEVRSRQEKGNTMIASPSKGLVPSCPDALAFQQR